MPILEINWKPDSRFLRQFGVVCLVMFGAIGAWIMFRNAVAFWSVSPATADTVAYALWAVGGAAFVLGMVAPKALWPLYVAMTAVALPIGFVMSYVVMGVIYYLIITPLGLAFRVMGRDVLRRHFDRAAQSYWTRRVSVREVRRYYRQF
jgi:hypothetical protein